MDALGLENDKQKRALLLHSIGERVFDIFVTLSGTGENYQTAKQKLDDFLFRLHSIACFTVNIITSFTVTV